MSLATFSSILLSSLLSSASAGPTPSAAPANIVVQVVHSGSKAHDFSFTVPVEGRVTARLQQPGDTSQRCEVRSSKAGQGIRMELKCSGSTSQFEVLAHRTLVQGKRTKVAEVDHPGKAVQRVFVTLR